MLSHIELANKEGWTYRELPDGSTVIHERVPNSTQIITDRKIMKKIGEERNRILANIDLETPEGRSRYIREIHKFQDKYGLRNGSNFKRERYETLDWGNINCPDVMARYESQRLRVLKNSRGKDGEINPNLLKLEMTRFHRESGLKSNVKKASTMYVTHPSVLGQQTGTYGNSN